MFRCAHASNLGTFSVSAAFGRAAAAALGIMMAVDALHKVTSCTPTRPLSPAMRRQAVTPAPPTRFTFHSHSFITTAASSFVCRRGNGRSIAKHGSPAAQSILARSRLLHARFVDIRASIATWLPLRGRCALFECGRAAMPRGVLLAAAGLLLLVGAASASIPNCDVSDATYFEEPCGCFTLSCGECAPNCGVDATEANSTVCAEPSCSARTCCSSCYVLKDYCFACAADYVRSADWFSCRAPHAFCFAYTDYATQCPQSAARARARQTHCARTSRWVTTAPSAPRGTTATPMSSVMVRPLPTLQCADPV